MKFYEVNFDELVKQQYIDLSSTEVFRGLSDAILYTRKSLNDDNIDVLYKVIAQNTVLKKLCLSGNRLTLNDGKLASAFSKNTTLERLSLVGNNIGPEGLKHLAEVLKENNTIQELNLDSCGISDEGAEYLGEIFSNSSLQWISLGGNNIGDKGIHSIATSLRKNKDTSLHSICLNSNNIGDVGAKKFADALEWDEDTINNLEIDCNNISDHVKERIEAILDRPERKDILIERLNMKLKKKDKEIAKKDRDLAKKDEDIAKKVRDIAKKDKHIASLTVAIRGQMNQFESILDPLDLTIDDDNEPPKKRPRTEDTPKSALAVHYEQNQQYSQRLVQVKQEKNTAEANLQDVREELEDAEELVSQQAVATNIWQGRFDELVGLLESGQEVDGASIAAIRNRSLASGS